MTAAASAPIAPEIARGFMGYMDPLTLFAGMAGTTFLVIAGAQLVASFYTDKLALRLFALRYVLAALGWFFVHPQAQVMPGKLPVSSMLVGAGLLLLTLVALDVYLHLFRWARLAKQLGIFALTCVGLWLHNRQSPLDPWGIYGVLSVGMTACAWIAWRAAAHERNAGHRIIAAAFLAYPLVVLMSTAGSLLPDLELAYLVALPSGVVGVAVLVASLIRFGRRLEAALRHREEADRALRELNATLEARVVARTQELGQIVQGLEAFVRNVSHDLRGPLAGVAGVARLAEDALSRGDTASAQRMIAPLGPQADRLASLVQDLLNLSRVTEVDIDRQTQPMQPLVDAALAQLALAPETSALLGEGKIDLQPLPAASVDASLMQQLFVNLIGNAVRFARQASARPTVRIGSEHHDGRTTFYVADNGPGFPAGKASDLFKPFALLHGQGLSINGIGLSIVQRVIERHQGRVWAESVSPSGAVFRFELGPEGAAG